MHEAVCIDVSCVHLYGQVVTLQKLEWKFLLLNFVVPLLYFTDL